MKRFIIICIIMALVLGLGVTECIVSTTTFEEMKSAVIEIERSIDDNSESLPESQALTLTESLISRWNEKKPFVLCTANHAITRSLDEKLSAMHSSIETGEYVNAKEYASVSLTLIEDLIDETHPIFSNLF